jgi:hypothetical protein
VKDSFTQYKISDVCERWNTSFWKLLQILFSKRFDVNDEATHIFNHSIKAKMY